MADEDDLHLDRKLLLGAYRGELPLDFVHEIGMAHLLELCPHCRQEVRAFRASADLERRFVQVFTWRSSGSSPTSSGSTAGRNGS